VVGATDLDGGHRVVLGRSWRTIGTLGVLGAMACLGLSSCHFAVPPKVMVVVMENQGYSQALGQPYIGQLAQQYGVATQSYGFGHPSLPNYLQLVSGSNEGVTDDGSPSAHSFPSVPTLADQLVTAGYSVAAYAESLPSDPSNDSGLYAVRHNPWPYFPSAPITVKDSSALVPDLNGASPPDFVWYTPNLTNDGHTGVPTDTEANELADAGAFLSSFIPSVQATSWYRSGGQIIIEWDEGPDSDTSGINGGTGGHVATIVVSQYLATTPQQSPGQVDSAGILASIEHIYQVPFLGQASAAANGNIDGLLHW
jgi:hypothetical protein